MGDGESGGTEERLWLKPMALLSGAVERVSEIAAGLLRYPNPHLRPLRPILLRPEVCRSVRHGGRIQPEPAVQRRADASPIARPKRRVGQPRACVPALGLDPALVQGAEDQL
jgi:hypothetical protein